MSASIQRDDLCFFIGGGGRWNPFARAAGRAARDRIVKVADFDGVMWHFKEPLRVDAVAFGFIGFVAVILAATPECLRPIKPGDGLDEVLRLAGKPAETPAECIADLAPKQQREFSR